MDPGTGTKGGGGASSSTTPASASASASRFSFGRWSPLNLKFSGARERERGSASSKKTQAAEDVGKMLKNRLEEKAVSVSRTSYRACRAAMKEAQTAELSNVPRVFATKQAVIQNTQQKLNAMPKILSEMDARYDDLINYQNRKHGEQQ